MSHRSILASLALACALGPAAALAEEVPHMGGVGDALRLPVIDAREQPWDALSFEKMNEISYLLVSLEAFMNAREAALHVEACRAAGASSADALAKSLARFEKQAARFIAQGRELAATGLSREQLHGGRPLAAAEIEQRMRTRAGETREQYQRLAGDPEGLERHCRTLGPIYLDSLIKEIYPARPDPKYRW